MNITTKKTIASLMTGAALLAALPVAAQTVGEVTTSAAISTDIDASGGVNANKILNDVKAKVNPHTGTAATAEVKTNAMMGADANVKMHANASTTAAARLTKAQTTAKARGDQEIDRRVKGLMELQSKVQGMKRITDAQKTTITAAIQAQITTLTTLKTKIDADADADSIKADVKSITDSYRIYALIMPQIQILTAADRIATTADVVTGLGVKLQTTIASLQAQGKDVTTLQTSLTDLTAKAEDARVQANAAVAVVAVLVPDNGDKAKMTANTAALKDARTKIKAGNQDIVAARKDITSITKALKTFKVSTGATASTTSETKESK